MKLILSFLMTAILNLSAFAAENTLTTQVTPPKWKSTFTSYFYDFEGTHAQKNNLYEFGDITLNMQMMSLSYQLDNGWMVMGLAHYYENNVVTKLGSFVSKDSSEGMADTIVAASKPVIIDGSFLLVTDVGVSLPTGSIDKKNPATLNTANYPYNMQMGSGTTDLVLGVTPLYLKPSYQLGSRLSAFVRTGEKNENGYRLGNQYRLDAWADMPLKYGFTPRVVGYYKHKDGIVGGDSTLTRSAYLEYYHHTQVNWDVSAALKYAYTFSPTVALNAEAGVPMTQGCQNYDDVVVSTQYYVNLGVTGQF